MRLKVVQRDKVFSLNRLKSCRKMEEEKELRCLREHLNGLKYYCNATTKYINSLG